MVIDGKAYGCIGLVVDNESCHVIDTVTVYPIVGFKLFEFNSSKLVDASIDKVNSCHSSSIYITEASVFIVYTDSYGNMIKCEIVNEPNRTSVSQDTPLLVFGVDGNLIFSPIKAVAHYYISSEIVLELDLSSLSYEFITGKRVHQLPNFGEFSIEGYGSFLERGGLLNPEYILDKVLDGAYLCADTLLVDKNIDSLVLPSGIEYLNFSHDSLQVRELVCNSELHHLYSVKKLPEKLYLSKDTSEELLCNIIYIAIERIKGEISDREYQEHRYSIGAMIGRGEYAKALEVYRSPDKKGLLERAFENTEIIVY